MAANYEKGFGGGDTEVDNEIQIADDEAKTGGGAGVHADDVGLAAERGDVGPGFARRVRIAQGR